ncbi:MAG TPA: BatA domain-containing protein [Steroidobacteraceae bacterium]|jgi:hypothetical protein
MGFLAPGFLFGALAIGVPLYLHLLRRNTSTPVPFSSLMFFERRPLTATQRRRFRYWLLLLLRLAVLLFLALAFAEPYLNRPIAGVVPESLQVIAIDNSFSMRAQNSLEEAKIVARNTLATRRSADRAQVLALGAQVHLLTQATRDKRSLNDAVESIQAGDSRGSYSSLAAVVRSIAESEKVPVVVHLIGDLQKTGMPPNFNEMALPNNVSLVLHPVGPVVGADRGRKTPAGWSAAANWAVESVEVPRQVWDPRTVHVRAVIAGYGTPAATMTASFIINGKTVATRPVAVPASGRATAEIDSLDLPYGFSRGSVKINSADSLAADDEYLFSIERSERKRGLFVYQGSDSRSALYFGTALTSAAQSSATLDKVTVDKVGNSDPAQYAFVVLCDVASLPAAFSDRLQKYVRTGGNVLVSLGTATAQQSQVPVLGQRIQGSKHYSREAERFAAVGETNTAFAAAGTIEEWEGVRFFYATSLDETDARVAVRLQDRTPLLLEKRLGEGRVLVFTSGFDNLTSDLPLHPVFVAFVERAVRYLTGGETGNSSVRVDDLLQLRTEREGAVGVEVTDPAGRPALTLAESTRARTLALSRAGFYEVRLANGRKDLVAANPDRRESDLAAMPEETLALWRGSGQGPGAVAPPAPPGAQAKAGAPGASNGAVPVSTAQTGMMPSSLWWYAVLALLLFALIESAIGSGYLGTLRDEP